MSLYKRILFALIAAVVFPLVFVGITLGFTTILWLDEVVHGVVVKEFAMFLALFTLLGFLFGFFFLHDE